MKTALLKIEAILNGATRQFAYHTGMIINNENEVGGWPAYSSGEPPLCTANDGIPDAWKKAHGLRADDPNVANALNSDGYSALEAYLNSLAAP